MTIRTRGKQILESITAHAPTGYDPMTDDFTVPFAIKLAEQDVEIERLRALNADLLIAAKAALHYSKKSGSGLPATVVDMMREAILKATGEQQ